MKGLIKHPLRVLLRLVWLGFELLLAALNYLFSVARRENSHSLHACAKWLHAASRRVLRIFDAEILANGDIPQKGLLVCNHLSYLDVLVLSAMTPCIFIAKSEVGSWPIFGWFARLAGALFTDRSRRTQVGPLTVQIQTALDERALVVLFPEGTSSDGSCILPFKSALLEPATDLAHCLTAGHIGYELEDGIVGEEVCYWKDMTFVPHLLNLLSKKRLRARLTFSELSERRNKRKELALELHARVWSLKNNHSTKQSQVSAAGKCIQGRLSDNNLPANGNHDLRFAVYDASTNGNPVLDVITSNSLG